MLIPVVAPILKFRSFISRCIIDVSIIRSHMDIFSTKQINIKQMKQKIIYLGLLFLPLTLAVTSCGGDSKSDNPDDSAVSLNEDMDEDMDEDDEGYSFSSATEAMDEYKNLVEEYASLLETESIEEAAELKMRMDELYSYSEGEFGSEIEALVNLSKLALDMEAGLDYDLDAALDSYGSLLDIMGDIPMDSDTEDALKMAKDAMDALESMPDMPDMPDLDDF